jgi:hypothetical protein
MARGNAALLAFNRGEISKIALARIDLEKMRLAAECQVNWMPFVLGPMMLRPGFGLVGSTKDQTVADKVIVRPFVFSPFDTALLELGDLYMRVWINDAQVTRVAVATAVTNGNFVAGAGWDLATGTTAGCTAVIAANTLTLTAAAVGGIAQARQQIAVAAGDLNKEHGLRFVVTRGPVRVRAGASFGGEDYIPQALLDTGTHSLSFTPVGDIFLQIESTQAPDRILSSVTIDAAGALEIPTPWSHADLGRLTLSQSGDLLFAGLHGYQQRKIERRSTHGWGVSVYQSDNGPFKIAPTVTALLTPSVYFGNGQLTSDRPFFKAGHVGCLFRLFEAGQRYPTLLGAANAFTPAIRVVGIGTGRNFNWINSGTYVGTLTLQRSFDGPDRGFVSTTSTAAGPATTASPDNGVAGYDNQIVWYRVGFLAGLYTSGSALVQFDYSGGSGYSGTNLIKQTPREVSTFGAGSQAQTIGGAYGICRVTFYNTPTSVNIEVLQQFSEIGATPNWVEGEWSGVPAVNRSVSWQDCPAIVDGRLWWVGGPRIFGSESDDYFGFRDIDSLGRPMGDIGVISVALGSGPMDSINWALPLTRLMIGREGSIASVRTSSFDQVLTPTTTTIKDFSTQGAARLPAAKIDERGVFVQASSRRVFEIVPDPQSYDYRTRDLTRVNLDIGKVGFKSLAVSRQPDTMIWLVRNDGEMACLLHDPEDQVECWWRMMTFGVIEDVTVLPTATGTEDLVYIVVRRLINGTWRRLIEKQARRDECEGGTLSKNLDCHQVFTGPTGSVAVGTTFTGATFAIWADGAARGTAVVDGAGNLALGGTFTNIVVGLGGSTSTYSGAAANSFAAGAANASIPAEVFADGPNGGPMRYQGAIVADGSGVIFLPNGRLALNIVAYFGFMAPFRSAKLAYAAELGTALNQVKKIGHLGLVAYDMHAASGLQFGQRFDKLDPLPAVEQGVATAANTVWAEYDERMIEVGGEWDTDARLNLLGQAPYPVKVAACVIDIETNEKNAPVRLAG